MTQADGTDMRCAHCGLRMRAESVPAESVFKGKEKVTRGARLVGHRCGSCGAIYCWPCELAGVVKKRTCPNCATPNAFSVALITVDGVTTGPLESTCALCLRPVPNERFLSIADLAAEKVWLGRVSGRQCRDCGATVCTAEQQRLGVGIRKSWTHTACPACGVLGGLVLSGLAPKSVPYDVRDLLKRLKKQKWVSADAEKRDLLAGLSTHGRAAVEVALSGDLGLVTDQIGKDDCCGFVQLARMAEIGARHLVGDTAIAAMVRLARDPQGDKFALDFQNPWSKAEAYRALGRIAAVTGNTTAVEVLISGLASEPEPARRAMIAFYLADVRGEQVEAALTAALADTATFERSGLPELVPDATSLFLIRMANPFFMTGARWHTVADIARRALQSLRDTPEPKA